MVGAFVGDINGSIYEFNNSPKTKNFELWSKDMYFTDDSVATIAVMDILLKCYPFDFSEQGLEKIKKQAIKSFIHFVDAYPSCGWGAYFQSWATDYYKNGYKPYNSFGNGSAMRISPVGWIAKSEEEVRLLSRAITEVTHSHPEGIKGAEATAMCIYLARSRKSKEDIKKYVLDKYYPEMYLLDYKNLVKTYSFDVTCQGTVPVAIYAFLISNSFEDCLRTAVAIGGDCDTLSCIACSIAEAFYYQKEDLKKYQNKVFDYLAFSELTSIVNDFNHLLFRIANGMGYLVYCETKEEFEELITFLNNKGVVVSPCSYSDETYNVIAISEDMKFASKKTFLAFYGDSLKNNKVKYYEKVKDFISKF